MRLSGPSRRLEPRRGFPLGLASLPFRTLTISEGLSCTRRKASPTGVSNAAWWFTSAGRDQCTDPLYQS